MSAQRLRLPQGDQATESALAVRGGSVEQDTSHRFDIRLRWPGIDAFSNARSGVAAFDGELADQGMGQRMQQDIPHRWEPILGILVATVLSPPFVGLQKFRLPFLGLLHPRLDCILRELEEHTLSSDIRGWHPFRSRSSEWDSLLFGKVSKFGVIAW